MAQHCSRPPLRRSAAHKPQPLFKHISPERSHRQLIMVLPDLACFITCRQTFLSAEATTFRQNATHPDPLFTPHWSLLWCVSELLPGMCTLGIRLPLGQDPAVKQQKPDKARLETPMADKHAVGSQGWKLPIASMGASLWTCLHSLLLTANHTDLHQLWR